MKFYRCEHCGNIIVHLEESGAPVSCCGEKMKELVPNIKEAAVEKHIPVYQVDGNLVTVQVGSVLHPMAEEHHISWIYLKTAHTQQWVKLNPGDEPKATFAITPNDKVETVFAYCNLHGLWKA